MTIPTPTFSLTDKDFNYLQHLHFDFDNQFCVDFEYKNTIPKFVANEKQILSALKLQELVNESVEKRPSLCSKEENISKSILQSLLEESKK